MPTVFTHAIAGAAIALAAAPSGRLRATLALAAAAAILPDIDALGVQFGFGHNHGLFGHRGVTHSLLFAAIVSSAAALLFRRGKLVRSERWRIGLCVFAAAASHGVLDALTNGGSGVAFFAPFDSTRYYFPVTPIRVSPMRASMLFTARGAAVMESEMLWVWIPAALVALASGALKARRKTRT